MFPCLNWNRAQWRLFQQPRRKPASFLRATPRALSPVDANQPECRLIQAEKSVNKSACEQESGCPQGVTLLSSVPWVSAKTQFLLEEAFLYEGITRVKQ